MFQVRYIPLRDALGAAINRTSGEKIDIDATGGVFIEAAPPGLLISFDNGASRIPARPGRAFDHPFGPSVILYHAPDSALTDSLTLITYSKDEGIFDAGANATAISGLGTGDARSGTYRVLCSFPYQNGVATRTLLYLYNPPNSGKNYTIRSLHTFQSSSGAATDDDGFLVGKTVVTPGADFTGTWGVAPKDAKALMYMDSQRRLDDPPLLARWAQQSGHALSWERRTILYPYQADMTHPLEGFILRPSYYLCYETAPVAANGMMYASLDESDYTP